MTILIVAGFTALALLATALLAAIARVSYVVASSRLHERRTREERDARMARMNPWAWNVAQDRAGVERVREMVRQRDLKRQEGT